MNKKIFKVGGLFSGIGGIESGFSLKEKFEILWASDIDKHSAKTYRKNYKHQFIERDINNLKGILLETKILETLQDNYYFDDERKFSFLKKDLSKIISLFSPCILSGGNNQNYSLLEIGVNNSNQGDGTEHIFVAKAMIAGFNASKVDVGS